MNQPVDVVVLGMGPGGEEVAGKLAEAGLSVVGIEGKLVGGECPYWGCVPSKTMIRAANLLAEARRIPGMAGHATVSADWAPVASRIRDEATDDWNDQVAVDRFTGKGGVFVRGWGRLAGPGRVATGDQIFQARRGVVITTGTSPAIPPIAGLAKTPYWTNREAIETKTLPASLLVLGGGAVGLELAQVFARFGVRVTVIEALGRLLAAEEPESSALAAQALTANGVSVVTAAARKPWSTAGSGSPSRWPMAPPTKPNGVWWPPAAAPIWPGWASRRSGSIRACGPSMWTNRCAPASGCGPSATSPGTVRSPTSPCTKRGSRSATFSANPGRQRTIPRCRGVTFTDPEIGAVGLTEAQAHTQGIRVQTGVAQVPSSARGWIHKAGNEGFLKLVSDADSGTLVGATSAGPAGGEVLGTLALAVHAAVPVQRL